MTAQAAFRNACCALALAILAVLGVYTQGGAAHDEISSPLHGELVGPLSAPGSSVRAALRLRNMLQQQPNPLTASDTDKCGICTTITTMITAAAKDSDSLQKLLDGLDFACSIAFSNDQKKLDQCKEVAKVIVKAVPFLDKTMKDLDWNAEAFCSVVVPVCQIPCCDASNAPEQVHLSLGDAPDEMVATWSTLKLGGEPTMVVSEDEQFDANKTVHFTGVSWTHNTSGWVGQMHSAKATGLQPGKKYYYRVGWDNNWSKTFYFNTIPDNAGTKARPLRMIQIGDVDYGTNGHDTLSALQGFVNRGEVDIIFHIGDISYADGYERHFDEFMRLIEPIAAYVPYMVLPGNHEFWFDFASYRNRFRMPGGDKTVKSMYYSFNVNNAVHVQMLNTETVIDTADFTDDQLDWMKKDLTAAKKATWRISMSHRPLYCTDSRKLQCETFAALLRAKAEHLLTMGRVDLFIAAHVHAYERTYPVAANVVMGKSYNKAIAPTHIVNGAGGNRENANNVRGDQPWSAKTSTARGYGFITIMDNTMEYKFVESRTGNVIDTVTFTK